MTEVAGISDVTWSNPLLRQGHLEQGVLLQGVLYIPGLPP